MPNQILAMIAAAAITLTRLQRARALFHEAIEQHVSKPPNPYWRRRAEEYERLRQRRTIRKVIDRHRKKY